MFNYVDLVVVEQTVSVNLSGHCNAVCVSIVVATATARCQFDALAIVGL